MAYTSTKRRWWAAYLCSKGDAKRVSTPFFGRTVRAANTDVKDAYRAFEQALLAAGYRPTEGGWIGSYACRKIAGSSGYSLHSYTIALDIEYGPGGEPDYNKHLRLSSSQSTPANVYPRCKFNARHVAAVLAIKNMQGTTMFRWLGLVNGDTMHWEIDVPPEKCKVDWSTVLGGGGTGDEQMLTQGDSGLAVTYYQKRILAADPGALPQYGADGDFGGETVEAVKDFQAGAEISPTGNIDGLTADLLSGSALDLVGATAPEGMLPLAVGDGEKNGKRPWKNSDVRAVQGMLREAGSAARFKWGVYDDTIMPAAIMEIIPETGGDSNGRAFHGNDWAPLLVAMRAAPGPHGHNEYAMVDHPHTVPAQTI